MNKQDKYQKVINALKSNNPVLTNKERMIDDIMIRIKESSEKLSIQEKLAYYLFGWVNIFWLRGTMAFAAVLFAGLFIIQQLMIADRLNKLEKQSIRMENMINGRGPLFGMNQKILVNSFMENQMTEDSITVSTHDLEEIVNNYWELMRDYEKSKQYSGPDHYKRKRIRKRLELKTNNDGT
jgi:hypothetical protein